MTKTSIKTTAAASAFVMTACVSSLAFAGFEWRGPIAPPQAAAPAPVQQPGPMGGLEPVIMWDGAVQDGAAPQMPSVRAQGVEQVPVAAAPASVPAPAATPISEGEVLEGFGSDLPLVIALQQITPPGYQVAFAQGVSPGLVVSWQGGKPWQDVLADMLAPFGLSYETRDGAVTVMPVSAVRAAAPAAALHAPAATGGEEDRVLLGSASETGVQVARDESVTIRREKQDAAAPTWLERLGLRRAQREEAPAPSAAPEARSADIVWMEAPPSAPQEPALSQAAAPARETTPAAAPARRDSTTAISPALARLGIHPYPAQEEETLQQAPAPRTAAEDSRTLVVPPSDLLHPPVSDSTREAPVSLLEQPPAAPAAEPARKKISPPETRETVAARPARSFDDAAAPATLRDADRTWRAARGETLRSVLSQWSEKAGVDMYWSIDYDYNISGDFSVTGSYDEAVGQILDRFRTVRPRPYGQLHQPPAGQKVLVIKSYDLAG